MIRATGMEVIRWCPGYEKAMFPLVGKELCALEVAVPSMLQSIDDFLFVQIGANDGVRCDPIRSLVEKYHLRGLLVEPLPDIFETLKENYASEPQMMFENAAIAAEDGEVSLYRFRPGAAVPDWAHGMATFNEKELRKYARKWKVEQDIDEVRVKSLTFQRLLDKHDIQKISLLIIDCEGFDFEVIKMALASRVLPDCIHYEFQHLSLRDRLESCRLLSELGYSFMHGRFDTFAVRTAPQEK